MSNNKQSITRRQFLRKCGQVGLFCMAASIPLVDIKPAFAGRKTTSGTVVSGNHVIIESTNPSINWNEKLCVGCGNCIKTCQETQTVYGYYDPAVTGESLCVNCGQCIHTCSKNALSEKDDIARVWAALKDPNMHVVIQTSPSSRVSLGEEFGLSAGTVVRGKQVTALRMLGFDAVFDTDFSADLTIMEESAELYKRLTGELAKPAPQFTSCCPGWVKFCEYFYPDLLENVSSCKSPQQMLGALIKTYYAQQKNIDPTKIFNVSVMPCTAKKFERQRHEMNDSGVKAGNTSIKDMDAVLTVRELASMIKQQGIAFSSLTDSEYDTLLGQSTGAGVIFGATGGVMESALRTLYYKVTGQTPPSTLLNLSSVRGLAGIKEASVEIPGIGTVNVAVCHGLNNARQILDSVRAGTAPWHFIEVMACPGGCIGGGGQPKSQRRRDIDSRINSIYTLDSSKVIRLSYMNPEVQQLYTSYLGEPMSTLAEELLHTSYINRGI